jgi:transcriptional regulator with XRE-family HTH domain
MTQEELSMVMGISPSGVSAIESGRNSLPPDLLEVVAKTLGVDLVAFTKVYLRWSNPWAFRILFAPDDRRIANELRNIPDRAGLDVFKGTRRNPRSRSH